MKRLFRSILQKGAPALFNVIRVIRHRRMFRRNFRSFQRVVSGQLFSDDDSISVLWGPFAGMRYFNETIYGSITPKWLGTYEAELHAILEKVVSREYTTIIDVGSAEGYYAVGLARRIKSSQVFAFDTDFVARNQVRRLAKMNSIEDRIEVAAFCHHSDIEACFHPNTLIVCDIEGSEIQLLDPSCCAVLRRCDILVELHDAEECPGPIEKLVTERFLRTHKIERVVARDRRVEMDSLPPGIRVRLSRDLLSDAVKEHRGMQQVWLWMETVCPA